MAGRMYIHNTKLKGYSDDTSFSRRKEMPTVKEFNEYGEQLERIVRLRTSPLAVKMLEGKEDIPAGAIRPRSNRGQRFAQCQAFALSRRNRETVAMFKEDSWCFAPLIAYGFVDKPDDEDIRQFMNFPTFERGKYVGIVSAPLATAVFEPDVVVVYSNTTQLRNMLLPLHFTGQDGDVDHCFFPPACAHLLVPVMKTNRYMVALPDFGEYERALASDDEIILSIPKGRMKEFMDGQNEREKGNFGGSHLNYAMLSDFPQPPFYQRLFERWGIS
jgi:uncharacterized protein (DUF169 family)